MSNSEGTLIEFSDLYDDAIEAILSYLTLEDLANISDTCRRLRNIAGSVFSQKHKNRFISFYAFERLNTDEKESYMSLTIFTRKNKPTARITDAKIWFKLLRNFGKSIKFIHLSCERDKKPDAKLQGVNEYIFEYCANSLETLELRCWPCFNIMKPLTKLQQFCGISFRDWKGMEMMPNLFSLHLEYVPTNLEGNFPGMEKIRLTLQTEEHANSFICFLIMNQHIKFLYLELDLDEAKLNYYSDIICNLIIENLTQLKVFKLIYAGGWNRRRHAALPHVQTYRFKTIDTFYFDDYTSRIHEYIRSFEFDNLIKLTLCSLVSNNIDDVIYILLRNKKLKIVRFKLGFRLKKVEIDRLQITLHQLPELKEIIINDKKEKLENTKKILGSEWKLVWKEERRYDNFKLKFQRIREKLEN